MKNILVILLFISLSTNLFSQGYFKGTMSFNPSTKVLSFFVKPVNGNITSSIGSIQFYVRYPNANTVNLGSITNNTSAFPGISMSAGIDLTNPYPGFTTIVFNFTSTIPSQTYTNNTPYLVFSVLLTGSGQVPLDLITNYIDGNSTFYMGAGNGDPLIDPDFLDVFYPNQVTSGNDILFSLAADLPLVLTNFEIKKENSDANLFWETESEWHTDHFEIERSVNSKDWEKIGQLKAAGNSNTPLNYDWVDKGVLDNNINQIIYYKLRMVDLDNKFTYSPIKSIQGEGQNNIQLFPNPSNGIVNLQFLSNLKLQREIKIFDSSGKMVYETQIELLKGKSLSTMNLQNLSSGTYLINVDNYKPITLIICH